VPLENIQQIIAGCINNDPRDQMKLYNKYYGYCLKIVFRYVYRYDKAVDIVNDGYVKVFRHFNKFSNGDPEHVERMLMGWMRTIMVNTAIDYLRKHEFTPEIGGNFDSVWLNEASSITSDQSCLYKELVSEIRKLPPGYRAVFNMFVIDGFTHQEIGRHLGISEGTSKSNLSKARVLLQKIIKKSNEVAALCG
jgi:RNA polymerase sigma factor (sigma-70 family)